METWTGNLIGEMHNAKITRQDIAKELGVTKAYVTMVLNGARKPPNARERFTEAFGNIKKRKEKDNG